MRLLHLGLVLCLLVAAGCGKENRSPEEKKDKGERSFASAKHKNGAPMKEKGPAKAEMKDRGPAGMDEAKAEAPLPRKIKYHGEIRLIVEDFARAAQQLDQLVAKKQGYFAQSEITSSPGEPRSGYWKLRIPVAQFNATRVAIVALGEPEKNTTDSEDLTEEFYDLQARIKNKKEEEAGLQKLFTQSAGKLEDILKISEVLTRVRTEIDQYQTRLRTLSRLTDMTTLDVHFRERHKYVAPESADFGTTIERTWSNSLEALGDFGEAVVLVAVAVAPWLPLLAVLVVPFWLLYRQYKRRRPTTVEPVVMSEVPPASPAG